MTYRVVKIEPCRWAGTAGRCGGAYENPHPCEGCRGDGSRMVEVAVVERPQHPDHPDGELVMWDDTGETAWDAHPNASEYARPLWVEVVSMSDPTAAEAAAKELANITGDHPWHKHFHTCVRLLDALGIDPDSPLSLLHWHATQTERERCARIIDRYDVNLANKIREGQ